MKNRFFILLAILMFLPLSVMAQRVVTGIVVDANTQQPLIGASLYWKNTTAGATTSVDGTFSIRRVSGFEMKNCAFQVLRRRLISLTTVSLMP